MFQEDNGSLLKKFKFYKNLLKRKSLMKRNSISMANGALNIGNLINSNDQVIAGNIQNKIFSEREFA